jgi:dynein heavy chain 2
MQLGLGGNPFGPAGTGKTETVKHLGNKLGRLVLVFNCDESLDVQSISRTFYGLASAGAWGCFDEFNRLSQAQLSAVSTVIRDIQNGLKQMIGCSNGISQVSSLNQ